MRIALLFLLSLLFSYKTPKPKLVWSDEFDYTGAPDEKKWDYDLGIGGPEGWGNHELECYTRDSKNVRVENGKLIIESHKDSLQGKPYTSTRILSRHKGDWTYGKVEIRAKIPNARGTWAALWMMPTNFTYGNWPASGEIDIMEHVGYDPSVIHGTIHTELYNHIKQTQKEGKVTVLDFDTNFHVYGLDWRNDKIDFLIDGKPYYTVTRDKNEDFKGWPFDKPFYIIMNLAVGGDWGGREGVDEKAWPQRLEVDYVRVYQ